MGFHVPLLRAVLVLVLLVFGISSVNAAETPKQITDSWGIFIGDADGQGVTVQGVTPASPGAKAGLQTGDVLQAINGIAVHSAQEFRAVKKTFPLYTPLHLAVKRNGTLLECQIILIGIVPLEVREIRSEFTIPGVPPPPAPVSLSAIEALDAVNVLDQVILESRSGKLAIIGDYDKRIPDRYRISIC
jgi:membrane-associated protease RseP (regulator of RpoE activity)